MAGILESRAVFNGANKLLIDENGIETLTHNRNHRVCMAYDTSVYWIEEFTLYRQEIGSSTRHKIFPGCTGLDHYDHGHPWIILRTEHGYVLFNLRDQRSAFKLGNSYISSALRYPDNAHVFFKDRWIHNYREYKLDIGDSCVVDVKDDYILLQSNDRKLTMLKQDGSKWEISPMDIVRAYIINAGLVLCETKYYTCDIVSREGVVAHIENCFNLLTIGGTIISYNNIEYTAYAMCDQSLKCLYTMNGGVNPGDYDGLLHVDGRLVYPGTGDTAVSRNGTNHPLYIIPHSRKWIDKHLPFLPNWMDCVNVNRLILAYV